VLSATSGAAVTPVTDKVATHSWGNWSSSCGERLKQHWLPTLGGQATGKQDVGGGKCAAQPQHDFAADQLGADRRREHAVKGEHDERQRHGHTAQAHHLPGAVGWPAGRD
jgi:hypothetical protein